VRTGDEIQQEQASTDEWVTDERRQHHAEQERCRGYERCACPCRPRAVPGPGSCRSHHRASMPRNPTRGA
jgi:hypothetical protein